MAVRRKQAKSTPVMEAPSPEVVNETPMVSTSKSPKDRWLTLGWTLLLLGGLAHMLPQQMAPILSYSWYNVSVQMAVGALSVIVALYYLMGE